MEGPIGGSFWGAFTEGPYWKDILEGPLFVHSSANKSPLRIGFFMGTTYRGPICGGRIKRALLQKPYEEYPLGS